MNPKQYRAMFAKLKQHEKQSMMADVFEINPDHVDTSGFTFNDFDSRDVGGSDKREFAGKYLESLYKHR